MCDILASYKSTLVMLTDISAMVKHPSPDLVTQVGLVRGSGVMEFFAARIYVAQYTSSCRWDRQTDRLTD